jgi:hypothetical protein
MDIHRAEEAQAALDRFRLEALLAADDERIDISVTDGWSDTTSAVPASATEIKLFPDPAEAGRWAVTGQSG